MQSHTFALALLLTIASCAIAEQAPMSQTLRAGEIELRLSLSFDRDTQRTSLHGRVNQELIEVVSYVHDATVGDASVTSRDAFRVQLEPYEMPFLADGTYLHVGFTAGDAVRTVYTLAVTLTQDGAIEDAVLTRDRPTHARGDP